MGEEEPVWNVINRMIPKLVKKQSNETCFEISSDRTDVHAVTPNKFREPPYRAGDCKEALYVSYMEYMEMLSKLKYKSLRPCVISLIMTDSRGPRRKLLSRR